MIGPIRKYPRTPHLEGSRLQPGDEDLAVESTAVIVGESLVIEEKIDGSNAAIRFDEGGVPSVQSRGHYLTGGARERQFDLLKTWTMVHRDSLFKALGSRHILYGEWVYAKHTIYYDFLPHYFLEFDILDLETETFLSTDRRRALLDGLPIRSVPVLFRGTVSEPAELSAMIRPTAFRTEAWARTLEQTAYQHGLDLERLRRETDPSPLSEGLYIKREANGRVLSRHKFVRDSFLSVVAEANSHWASRPICPNALAPGVDIFAP